jgi:hypothetical protein
MKDERDRACSTQGGRAKFIEGCFLFADKLEEGEHLEVICINGDIILK